MIFLAVYLLYRYLTRARQKIRDIRGNCKELTHRFLDHKIGNPVPVGLKDEAWLRHLREQRAVAHALRPQRRRQADKDVQNISLECESEKKDISYTCLDELESNIKARYVS
jgi:hypothetical protein